MRSSLFARAQFQNICLWGSHANSLQLRAFVGGKWEIRSYTPIFFDNGFCEIFFRVYSAPEGAMSRHLQNLQQDDWVEMKGPIGANSHKLELTHQGFGAFGGNRSKVQ
jgi:NAD(P)H-flavin reductase